MLFALYAARQTANLRRRGTGRELAAVLAGIQEATPLSSFTEMLDEVSFEEIEDPRGAGGGLGFTAHLRPWKRAFFKLHARGFGLLARGVDYYAPVSTLVLLAHLLERHFANPSHAHTIARVAQQIGLAGIRGEISARSQAPVAMSAIEVAWDEANEADLNEALEHRTGEDATHGQSLKSREQAAENADIDDIADEPPAGWVVEGNAPARDDGEISGRMRTASEPDPDPLDQIERLARLRDAGILAEEEFQTKKDELLRRI